MSDFEEVVSRLEGIAEELADRAIDSLRQAIAGEGDNSEERRITRARRAVERAIVILGGRGDDTDA